VDSDRSVRRRARVLAGCAAVMLSSGCVRALPVDPDALGGQAATSVVLAADGSRVTSLHVEQDRTPLPLTKIPDILVKAVVATEDRRFFEHKGVDVRGIGRAALADVRAGRVAEGGSTITQQLVKNTMVGRERSLKRKIREASLAIGLEKTLSKEQILERYLNTVYFGQGTYGVGAAIRVYLGHSPAKVTVAEAALLAGLVRSPSSADPINHPKAAKQRRAEVLRDMLATGVITERQLAVATRAPLPRRPHRDDRHYPAAHAVADAVEELRADERLGETQADRDNAIFRGGLTIRLTIDPAQQRAAERAVADTLDHRGDPAAGVAVVEPGDGAIRAMVGGRDFFSRKDPVAKVNLARGGITKRQAGSTFKAFTLIAALEGGLLPDDVFKTGSAVSLPRPGGRKWEVTNSEGSSHGEITLRTATEKSVNTAYARVVQRLGRGDVDLGARRVVEVAERLGVRGRDGADIRTGPATTLGAQEVDPVQMAAAYATLATGGIYAEPYLVSSVKDARGRTILSNEPAPRRLVSRPVATVATDLLRGVVARGTGRRADIGRPQAGKTGTSSNYHDAWYVGYTPDFAAAVWVGVPRGQVPMTPRNGFRLTVTGGTFPAVIWSRLARSVLAGRRPVPFPALKAALVEVEVDAKRGCLATEWTPAIDRQKRSYLAGSQPRKPCGQPTIEPRPADVIVPDIVGLDEPAALLALRAAGLEGAAVVEPSCLTGEECAAELARTAGLVWHQDVAPGERVSGGTVIGFVVQPALGDVEPTPTATPSPSPEPTPASTPSGSPSPSATP
jgi:penicillin-binding protein 1A